MNNKIKILHVSRYSPNFKGGIESLLNSINKSFDKSQLLIDFFFFTKDTDDILNFEKNFIPIGFKFIFLSQPISFKYIFKFFKIYKNYDFIHFHLPNLYAFFMILFCKRRVIIHWHSDIITNFFIKKLFNIFENIILKKCEKIICSNNIYFESSKVISKFKKKKFILKPLPNLYFYGDVLKVNNDKKIINNKYCLTVGRLVNYKGHKLLIRSFAKIKDENLNLVIVGNGPNYGKLIRLIDQLNMNRKIFIFKNISNEELINFYKNAHFFCLTSLSRAESFGLVLLEAIMFQLPLLTTRVFGSGMNSINNDNIGIISEINEEELTKNILSLFQNKIQYNKFKINLVNEKNKISLNEFKKNISLIYDKI